MIGFRLLAIVLGIICLATAVGAVFHTHPALSGAVGFLVEKFVPAGPVRMFVRSSVAGDVQVKSYLKYIFSGYAVLALATGILFFISAANPIRMRPFISVVMIGAVVWIGIALWKGLSLDINYLWWLSDSIGALILLVLLAALYPRRRPKRLPPPAIMDEELEE